MAGGGGVLTSLLAAAKSPAIAGLIRNPAKPAYG